MAAQAKTVDAPQRWPLIAQPDNRDETTTKDARLVNGIAEKDLLTGEYHVEKRPGLAVRETLSGVGRGTYNWKGDVYSIFGGTIYQNGVALGSVDTTNGDYQFQIIHGDPGYLVFGNGTSTYYTQGTALTTLKILGTNDISAGALQDRTVYSIETVGTTDFTTVGAADNTIGTVFVATGPAAGTGTASIVCSGFIAAGAFHSGSWYSITTLGTTDFTLIGASSNAVGTIFKATGVGVGTGVAALLSTLIIPGGTPPNFYNSRLVSQMHLVVGQIYQIDSPGTFDWTTVGASSSVAGVVFTATAVGAPGIYGASAKWLGQPLVDGDVYVIKTLGTTNFTLIGAASNTVGLQFTASGVSAGTGTVYLADFPSGGSVKGFAYLDGTLYVMDAQGRIWGTLSPPSGNYDDPTKWDPLNLIWARIEPDAGVCLAKQAVYVIALKQWTTEVFYDAMNAVGSPLAPVQGAKSPYGCLSADTVQSIDDMLFWVSNNRTTSPQIAMMAELKTQIISIPPVERLLDGAVGSTFHSWVFRHGGHRFYGVTCIDKNLTLVWDIDQRLWYQWTDASGNYWPINSIAFDAAGNRVAQHVSNGKLYNLEGDYTYPNDDGTVVPVDIYTPNVTFGIDRRKVLNMMRVDADQTNGSLLYVRCSDDDYRTWSNFRLIDLGTKRPILSNCGTFYRRAYHFHHHANTPLRIRWVDLQMDIGTL